MLSPTHLVEMTSQEAIHKPVPPAGLMLESALGPAEVLEPAEVERLLHSLVQARWERLPAEYSDVLGMLFGQQSGQWTAGWSPHEPGVLYLLVWELLPQQKKALWRLYRNGNVIFEELDGTSRERSALCHTLMESLTLPTIRPAQFLEKLEGYQYAQADRDDAAQALEAALLVRPEMLEPLRGPLFQLLESELDDEAWPLLDILKVHRLSHKNNLLRLLGTLCETGLIATPQEQAQLARCIQRIEAQYHVLAPRISHLFRPVLDRAYVQFQVVRFMGQTPEPLATR